MWLWASYIPFPRSFVCLINPGGNTSRHTTQAAMQNCWDNESEVGNQTLGLSSLWKQYCILPLCLSSKNSDRGMPLFVSIYPFQTQISWIFVCYRSPLSLWKLLNYLSTHTITFLVILLNFAFDEQELFPIYFHFPKKQKAFAKWHLYHDTVCLKWQSRGLWVPSPRYHSSHQNWAWNFSGLHKTLSQERHTITAH